MWRAPPWGPSEERMRAMSRSLSRRRAALRSPFACAGASGGTPGGGRGSRRLLAQRGSLHQQLRRRTHHSRRRKARSRGASNRRRSLNRRLSRGGGGRAKGWGARRGRTGKGTRRGSLRRGNGRVSSRQRRESYTRRGNARNKSASHRNMKLYSVKMGLSTVRSLPSLTRSPSRSAAKGTIVRGSTRRLSPIRSSSPQRGCSPVRPTSSAYHRGSSPGRRSRSGTRARSPRRFNNSYNRGRSPRRRSPRRLSPRRSHPGSPSSNMSVSRDHSPKRSPTPPRTLTANNSDKDTSSVSTARPDKLKTTSKDVLSSLGSASSLFRPLALPSRFVGDRPNSPVTAVASLQAITDAKKRATSGTVIVPAKSTTQLPLVALPVHPLTPPSGLHPTPSPPPPGTASLPGQPVAPTTATLVPPVMSRSRVLLPSPSKNMHQGEPEPQQGTPVHINILSARQCSSGDAPESCPLRPGSPASPRPGTPSTVGAALSPLPPIPSCYPHSHLLPLQNPFPPHPLMVGMQQPRAESPPPQKARTSRSEVPLTQRPSAHNGAKTSQTTITSPGAVYERESFFCENVDKRLQLQTIFPQTLSPVLPLPLQERNRMHPFGSGFYYGPACHSQVTPEALAAAKAHAARVAALRTEALRTDALRKIADAERERELETTSSSTQSPPSQHRGRHYNHLYNYRARVEERELSPGRNCLPDPIHPNTGGPLPPYNPMTPSMTSNSTHPMGLFSAKLISTAKPIHPDAARTPEDGARLPSATHRRPRSSRPTYPTHLLGTHHPLYAMAVASSWQTEDTSVSPHRSLVGTSPSSPHQPLTSPPAVAGTVTGAATISARPATENPQYDYSRRPRSSSRHLFRHHHQSPLGAHQAVENSTTSRDLRTDVTSQRSDYEIVKPMEQGAIILRNPRLSAPSSRRNIESSRYSGDYTNEKDIQYAQTLWEQRGNLHKSLQPKSNAPWQQWALPTQTASSHPLPPHPRQSSAGHIRTTALRPIHRPPSLQPMRKETEAKASPGHWLPTPSQSPSSHRLSPNTSNIDTRKQSKESTPGGGDTFWRTYYYEEQLYSPSVPIPKHHEL